MSSVFDAMHGRVPMRPPTNQNGNLLSQIQQFARSMSGNPEQIVRGMLQNGQMTKEQFNNLGQQATQMMQMFHLR